MRRLYVEPIPGSRRTRAVGGKQLALRPSQPSLANRSLELFHTFAECCFEVFAFIRGSRRERVLYPIACRTNLTRCIISEPSSRVRRKTTGEVRPYEHTAGLFSDQRPRRWSISGRANQIGRRGARKPPESSGDDSNRRAIYGESPFRLVRERHCGLTPPVCEYLVEATCV